jgi:hypothetical protein
MAMDPDSPQVVARSLTEPEAAVFASHLESLGIKTQVWGATLGAVWPEVPCDVQVVVRQADSSRARAALDQLHGKRSEGR